MRRTLALTALVAALLIPLRPGAEAADRSKARAFSLHVPQPGGVVSAAGFLWIQSGRRKAIWKVSSDGTVVDRIPGVARAPSVLDRGVGEGGLETLGAGFGSIWSLIGQRVLRIDPNSDRVVGVIPVGGDATCLAVGAGAVWVGNARGLLIRIDPVTQTVARSHDVSATPAGLDAGAGHVWWLNISESASISVFDRSGRRIVRQLREPLRSFVVVARHEVWTADHDGSVSELRTGSGRFDDSQSVASSIMGVSSSRGVLWLNAGDLIGIDAQTGRVLLRRQVARPMDANAGVAQLGGNVWLSEPGEDRVVAASVA